MAKIILGQEKNLVPPPESLEKFEDLLEVYKVANPAKYAIKLAAGDFDRQRARLYGVVPEVKAEVKPEVKEKKLNN